MAWASKKQYAILMSSEEGKDLAEKLPDLEQEDFATKFGELIGKQGIDYQEDEEDKLEETDEEDNEVSDDDISEALADYEWQITDKTTAGQYAQECADRLGIDKDRVMQVMEDEYGNALDEGMKMSEIMGFDDEDEEAIKEKIKERNPNRKGNNDESLANELRNSLKMPGDEVERFLKDLPEDKKKILVDWLLNTKRM